MEAKCACHQFPAQQVGDMNFWNLDDPSERFYSGKTRQLHSAHLSTYDRLWSVLPYLRPMATVVADSIKYGIDADGAGVHDVIGEPRAKAGVSSVAYLRGGAIRAAQAAKCLVRMCLKRRLSVSSGTRCDDYTYKLITGTERWGSCHSYLTKAATEAGLSEHDVHDVWNIFMCTGFTKVSRGCGLHSIARSGSLQPQTMTVARLRTPTSTSASPVRRGRGTTSSSSPTCRCSWGSARALKVPTSTYIFF